MDFIPQASASRMHLSLRAKKGIDKYPAKAHAQRVGDQLGREKCIVALVGEKAEFFSNSDMPRPFRQDRYFYYISGCSEPGCSVTYDVEHDKLTLWLPPINLDRVYYDGRGSTVEQAMELYDIDEAVYLEHDERSNSNLCDWVNQRKADGCECIFIRNPLSGVDLSLYGREVDRPESPGLTLRKAMNACRAVKDEHEIALIRKANAVSAEGHVAILKSLHRLHSEPEVEGVYRGTCISLGTTEQSYGPICGAGEHASQLHYVTNKSQFADAEVLLIDAGAEWECYASDVTRTMPINKHEPGTWKSKEAKAVYKHVEKIQEKCIAMLRPGVHFMDVMLHSVHMAIDALLDLGILKGKHMDIFHDGVSAGFYPHGLGHHIGLEVHDVEPPTIKAQDKEEPWKARFADLQQAHARYVESTGTSLYSAQTTSTEPRHFSIDPTKCLSPSTPADAPLTPGMVVTIEPGIYFNAFVLETFYLDHPEHRKYIDRKVLERYMHVGGVRIEDDILITKDGYENLTTAPKGEEMLRIIRKGKK
ncbi:peptidase M24 [Neohortaea acidophila]|uniref:Xaa-Pro aminopeptidase n=1 Tax=Neohortaea acidophila TaxID=245834 RepID=A0A6A6PLV0_9PEZI|nr:peptidase M24 [Neohortaea acidophila]KAF2480443.1 peptidase M24 [Neohortaea acidophila]